MTLSAICLAALVAFCLGLVVGNGYTTRAQDARDRRQASIQRHLNDEWRIVRQLKRDSEEHAHV